MKYVMTLGGLAGPQSRSQVLDALKSFHMLFEREATDITVMPAGWSVMRKWLSPLDAEETERMLVSGGSVSIFGLKLTLGLAYTISG